MKARFDRGRAPALAVAISATFGVMGCQIIIGIQDSPLAGLEAGSDAGRTADAQGPYDGAMSFDAPANERDVSTADAYAAPDAGVGGASDAGPGDSSTFDAGGTDAGDGGSVSDGGSPDGNTASGCDDAGMGGDAGIDAAPACVASDPSRCSGQNVQACVDGGWVAQATCLAVCQQGACKDPPSCSNVPPSCGATSNESCCSGHPVAGGTFQRAYDVTQDPSTAGYYATVNTFILDDFEVTTARFAQFVAAYPADDGGLGSIPVAHSGANPSDPTDMGWNTSWPLPADREALTDSLTSCQGNTGTTWGPADTLPVNCVSWYVAYAFCIWDGGRLPTEAEWNYAAAGGSEQLVFPWSSDSNDESISSADAVFYPESIEPVGSKLPNGVGPWFQADLVGNVSEWVRDAYASPFAIETCDNCADFTENGLRVYRGGDTTELGDTGLAVSVRYASAPDQLQPNVGIRCARAN